MPSEKGFSFIETLIALAIFSVICVGMLSGLATSAKSNIIMDEQTTAESLARTQLEYVQDQPYDSANNPPLYSVLSSLPVGYSVVTPMATRLDPIANGIGNDDGLQRITISIQRNGKTVFELEGYKVQR